jgi:hypothetical protein
LFNFDISLLRIFGLSVLLVDNIPRWCHALGGRDGVQSAAFSVRRMVIAAFHRRTNNSASSGLLRRNLYSEFFPQDRILKKR